MTFGNNLDYLKIYFMRPYTMSNGIVITQPTVGQIVDYGEENFYSMLNPFVSNPTSYRVFLWDHGIDWCKIADYELFQTLIGMLSVEQTRIIFGDLDFRTFERYTIKTENEDEEDNPDIEEYKTTLYSKEFQIEISEEDYEEMALYLRTMFNMFPKIERAKNKATKESIIFEDKMNMENKKKKDDENSSSLLFSLISACVNHPGFKYKPNELEEIGIFQFMDSVKRLQVYEQTTALLSGKYSGMIDTKGIPDKEFNYMRDIYSKNS